MGNINVGRWIVGGVVAAIVLFVVDFVVNGMILEGQWTAAMTALNKPAMAPSTGQLIMIAVLNLLVGLTALWIYVGIRPRFGAGATTAVYAGLATWVVGYLVPNAFMIAFGLLPAGLMVTLIVVGVIQVPVATVAGAYFYQE
ncbi:MAG: hypothetical protein WD036_02585 [Bauldia sp.]